MAEYQPFVNLGPGDSIKEELAYYGWDQKALAEILGKTEKHISSVLNNKTVITFDMARELSAVFRQSPEYWLNLDAQHRLRLQKDAKNGETAAKALIYRYMPVRELRKRGYLPRAKEALIEAVKDFWSMEKLDFGFLEKRAEVNLKKSENYRQFNPYHALTWQQIAQNSLKNQFPERPCNRATLLRLASSIPTFSTEPGGLKIFLNRLIQCGVIFAVLPHLSKTYTDGAAFWIENHPVILYTCRQDRIDNFWFTMAHEIGHVALHGRKRRSLYIDSLEHLDLSNAKEKEADDFATGILKSKEILTDFGTTRRVSEIKIRYCAERLGLHPAIVLGCLQHHGRASYKALHKLKSKVSPMLPDDCKMR